MWLRFTDLYLFVLLVLLPLYHISVLHLGVGPKAQYVLKIELMIENIECNKNINFP